MVHRGSRLASSATIAIRCTARPAHDDPDPLRVAVKELLELHAFALASRRRSTRRQRVILASVSLALVVSVSLASSRSSAQPGVERAEIARSQASPRRPSRRSTRLPRPPSKRQSTRWRPSGLPRPGSPCVGRSSPTRSRTPSARTRSRTAGAGLDALSFSDDALQLVGLTPDDVPHVWRCTTGRPAETARATMSASVPAAGDGARPRRRASSTSPAGRAPRVARPARPARDRRRRLAGGPRAAIVGRRTIALEDLSRRHAVSLELRPSRGTRALFSAEGDRVTTFAPVTLAQSGTRPGTPSRTAVGRGDRCDQPGRPVVATVGYGGAATLWSAAGDRVAHLGPAGGVVFSPDSKRRGRRRPRRRRGRLA